MNLPTKAIYTIEAGSLKPLKMPQVVDGDCDLRDSAVFHIMSPDERFGIVGTFDEINDFAAEVFAMMCSWVLTTGHSDWFGDELQLLRKKDEDERDDGAGRSGRGGDCGESAGERDGQPGPSAT